VASFALDIQPGPTAHRVGHDAFGNRVDAFVVQRPHRQLAVSARSEIAVERPAPPDPAATPPWEALAAAPAALEVEEFRWESPLIPASPALRVFARAHIRPGQPVLAAALALTHAIHRGFVYDPRATAVDTPVAKALELRRGVCQDFAGVLIGALRALGLPARYVSGYLETDPPPGRPRLVGADATHAWVQAWCGPAGWIHLDPTNGCIPGDRHLVTAVGRDFADVSPLRGMVLGGGASTVQVAVDVLRVSAEADPATDPAAPR
jgi:transglutaminase-like putative cysteine protease